jgi:hypothetical protein
MKFGNWFSILAVTLIIGLFVTLFWDGNHKVETISVQTATINNVEMDYDRGNTICFLTVQFENEAVKRVKLFNDNCKNAFVGNLVKETISRSTSGVFKRVMDQTSFEILK